MHMYCLQLYTYSAVASSGVFYFQAFCEPGNVQENGVLAFVKHVLFPVLDGKGAYLLYSDCRPVV